MAILIDRHQRVLVQGITGREGIARTQLMSDYGTQVVAGVTPGKGGQSVLGLPVYDTVYEACERVGSIEASVLYVPAPLVKSAALEALEAGIKLLVIVPDRVPLYDVLEIAAAAKACGAQFIGPNTLGVLSPDEAVIGMMGGSAASIREWATAGPVGISSRSGGISTSLAYYIAQEGIGLSTIVHVGGDSVVGMTHADILRLFQTDSQTEVVLLFGEIGSSQEEDVADLLLSGGFSKPLVAYIGGKAAQEGVRFSHAGAIIEGHVGTHAGKVRRLREAGAVVAEHFSDIPRLVAQALDSNRTLSLPPRPDQARSDSAWHTAITSIQPNAIRVRGHAIEDLMGNVSFGQALYLILTGELPGDEVGHMVEAILVSSIDHGVTPPSTLAARTATSTGATLNAALAVGLLSINEYHGGAIEACMRMLAEAVERHHDSDVSRESAALETVQAFSERKERLPGYGHRVHTDDPRAQRLLALASAQNTAADGVSMARAIEAALAAQTGRRLPLNVDGAIAAVLLDIGIPASLGNAFFMMARLPGLIAHINEEQVRERKMRIIDPRNHSYDGPEDR